MYISGDISIILAGGYNRQIGDLNDIEVLNENGQCNSPDLPSKIISSPAVFQHGENVLLCAGDVETNDKCLKLDRMKESWTPFNNLNFSRALSTMVQMKTETYLLGGGASESMLTSEILSHYSNTWQKGPDIPEPGLNSGCAVKISDTEFLVIGGQQTYRRILKFNTHFKRWSNTSIELNVGRCGHRCIMINEKILITGGTGMDGNSEINSTEIIDVGKNGQLILRKGKDMNEKRDVHGIGFIKIDDTPQAVIVGGFYRNAPPNNTRHTIEIWNDANETWLMSNLTLNLGRSEFGFATLPTELLCPYFKLKKK